MQFDWKYLALFEKAADTLRQANEGSGRGYVIFQPCAEKLGARITITGTPEFEGAVMSLRTSVTGEVPYEEEPELQEATA